MQWCFLHAKMNLRLLFTLRKGGVKGNQINSRTRADDESSVASFASDPSKESLDRDADVLMQCSKNQLVKGFKFKWIQPFHREYENMLMENKVGNRISNIKI
jgi:hypothetical protein